jgi:hypothetical protein
MTGRSEFGCAAWYTTIVLIALIMAGSNMIDLRTEISISVWRLRRLEKPYRCRSQCLVRMNLWKTTMLRAICREQRMMGSSRCDAQGRRQLAWYQIRGRCWSREGSMEGSGRQRSMAWQRPWKMICHSQNRIRPVESQIDYLGEGECISSAGEEV